MVFSMTCGNGINERIMSKVDQDDYDKGEDDNPCAFEYSDKRFIINQL
jgi:hypothetical protein